MKNLDEKISIEKDKLLNTQKNYIKGLENQCEIQLKLIKKQDEYIEFLKKQTEKVEA